MTRQQAIERSPVPKLDGWIEVILPCGDRAVYYHEGYTYEISQTQSQALLAIPAGTTIELTYRRFGSTTQLVGFKLLGE
jgi:hypothetical protein